ncbi:unnamed protein product [Victoria cruziana]
MTDADPQFFPSLIAQIKDYDGSDPLIPWLRGIRMMKQALAPDLLKQKLPRFLQKCVLAFKDDRRYRNDARFVQVCVVLMDFVDDPGELLNMMESCRIGTKRALFYQAHALYYEKRKKYVEAEKIYQLGVKILAVPTDELQKSYQQFLNRMQTHKRCKAKARDLNTSIVTMEECKDFSVDGRREPPVKADKVLLSKESFGFVSAGGAKLPAVASNKENLVTDIETLSKDARGGTDVKENLYLQNGLHNSSSPTTSAWKEDVGFSFSSELRNEGNASGVCVSEATKQITDCGSSFQLQNDGVVEAYQFSSFCGDDTIVVSKFVDCAIDGKSEAENACHHGLVDPTINTKEVMNDINSMFKKPLDIQIKSRQKAQKFQVEKVEKQEKFEIFVDESLGETGISGHEIEKDSLSSGPVTHGDETIMICRFTDAALVDDSDSSEAAYHHGLVEPTLFTKEAMSDINSMFGKPIEFDKPSVRRKDMVHNTNICSTGGTFEILIDDDDFGCSGSGCFANESAQVRSQSQLSCGPKFQKFEAHQKQECTERDIPSTGVLTILADDDIDDNGCCDYKNKQFDCENMLQFGSHTETCSATRTGDGTSAGRFIGTTVVEEPEVDACRHDSVDPMINLKEAKSFTNSTFKRQPDFGEANGTDGRGNPFRGKQESLSGFTVPVDENLVASASHLPKRSVQEIDLFEHTITTKEAITDINNMFGRPLDY